MNRQISLPYELNIKLSEEPNASLLIRDLLEQHYSHTPFSDMGKDELKAYIKKEEAIEAKEVELEQLKGS